jgi:hypothetical protein
MAAALSTNPVLLVRLRRDAANQRGRSQAHRFQTVDTTPPACNGYVLTIACKCGVIFERWITPQDAALDLLRLANRRRSPTQYDERGWRATFYTTGMEHSPTSATGTGWEPTPWRAVQGAARDALRRAGVHG